LRWQEVSPSRVISSGSPELPPSRAAGTERSFEPTVFVRSKCPRSQRPIMAAADGSPEHLRLALTPTKTISSVPRLEKTWFLDTASNACRLKILPAIPLGFLREFTGNEATTKYPRPLLARGLGDDPIKCRLDVWSECSKGCNLAIQENPWF
jgi:hypothetical protein